jgi:hypothetical protein
MTKRDLLAMALKFTGIVYFIQTICYFLNTIRAWHQFTGFQDLSLDFSAFWAINITSSLLEIILSLVLIRWGDGLARLLIRHDAALLPLAEKQWEKHPLEAIVKFLGILYLLWGLPELITEAAGATLHWKFIKNEQAWFTKELHQPLQTILIGFALIVLCYYLVAYAYPEIKAKAAPSNVT